MDVTFLKQFFEYVDLVKADESGIIKRLIKEAYRDGWVDGMAHRVHNTKEEETKAFESDWENSWLSIIESEQ